ncbi:Hypothetical protein HDN1F_11500 [gamma proteobacterium HdN1]|nr:Hypothetical protein HDN1F_11500 [gamma proteobacterium HdN1]
MTLISLERILELLCDGLYSGCVALVVEAEKRHRVLALLQELGTELYDHVRFMALDSETAIDLALESIDGDLLLIDGLSKISPHSQEAYALRTFLDVRRNTAGKTIIILDPKGYRSHFSDSDAPFYLFCDFVFESDLS